MGPGLRHQQARYFDSWRPACSWWLEDQQVTVKTVGPITLKDNREKGTENSSEARRSKLVPDTC